MTCVPHKDWLFYILYCGDKHMITSLIQQCARNILATHDNAREIKEALDRFMPRERDGLLHLRVKFFVLLHEDELTRREFTNRTTSLVGHFGPIAVEKANNFYQEMHITIFPHWVSNEEESLDDLVNSLRMAYLIA